MQETIDLIIKYGYIILFLYSLGGGFVALIGASVLSWAGKMDLTLSITVAIVANFLGDLLLFYLTRYQKESMLGYIKKHKRKIAYINILMKKYGSIILIVQKYIYGIKTLVPAAVALTKYSFVKFNIYNAIGAIIWGISIGLLGYFLGEFIVNLVDKLSSYPYIAPIFIFVLFGLLWLWLSKVSKK